MMCNFSNDVIQATMQLMCNFSNGSHCSYLFEDVHVSITTIKAIFSMYFIMAVISRVLVGTETRMMVREKFDNLVLLAISFLIANIVISLVLESTDIHVQGRRVRDTNELRVYT